MNQIFYTPWIQFVQSSKPFLSLPFGTGLSKWINQVNLLICQNRISKQKNCKRKARGGVEVWPQWLRRQFSQLETLRPNWLHTTAYCYTLNTTATASTSLLLQLYQINTTNSSSPWEINLLWGGKGESLEQVFLWGKPLDHFEQIFHFDTSSKDHNRTSYRPQWNIELELQVALPLRSSQTLTTRGRRITQSGAFSKRWMIKIILDFFVNSIIQLAFDDHPWFMFLITHVSRRSSMIHD